MPGLKKEICQDRGSIGSPRLCRIFGGPSCEKSSNGKILADHLGRRRAVCTRLPWALRCRSEAVDGASQNGGQQKDDTRILLKDCVSIDLRDSQMMMMVSGPFSMLLALC